MPKFFKKKEKESVVRDIKNSSAKKKSSNLIFSILALVLTIVIFGGLLFLQSFFKEKIVYKSVVCAKTDIPEGEIITEDNAQKYFEMKNINILDTSDKTLTELNPVVGERTKVALNKGETVAEKDFDTSKVDLSQFKEPVEISVPLGDPASSNGGKIRAGDVVNLAMMYSRTQLNMSQQLESVPVSSSSNSLFSGVENMSESSTSTETTSIETSSTSTETVSTENADTTSMPETTSTSETQLQNPTELTSDDFKDSSSGSYIYDYYGEYVIENVTVEKALDSKGIEIQAGDTDSVASILMFVIDKSDEIAINNALANCSNIRVSKVFTSGAETKKAKVTLKSTAVSTNSTETKVPTSTSTTGTATASTEAITSSTQASVTKTDTITTTKATQ